MKKALLFIIPILIFSCSCQGKEKVSHFERDTTINKTNSYSEIFLDSLLLERFIGGMKPGPDDVRTLRNFYNSRNYQYAWFTKEGLAEQALAFWNLQQNYISFSNDSLLLDSALAASMKAFITGDSLFIHPSRETTELCLTMHFFKYAKRAYAGRIDPAELQWYIPRKKVDEMVLLDSLIANKGRQPESWEPVNRQYTLMKKYLEQYNVMQEKGLSESILIPAKAIYRDGDSSKVITAIKKRLTALGDYTSADTSPVYNPELIAAIKQFQKRHGLKQHGIINSTFLQALNTPLNERIRQMLVNMERIRWLPAEHPGNLILANIPEFKLRVFEGAKKVFDMDIIVGKEANKTIVFNDMLEYVVFSPYWNVPPSIVRNEIVPAMAGNKNYLSSKNMEVMGYSGGLPVIRQRPGGANSLGRVKFLFPNDFNIYFHDTPVKSLFKEQKRAFSHGCIRLSDPQKLAQYLLRDQPGWSAAKISKAMDGPRESWVRLKERTPIVITYFTAWVDHEGLLNFRNDVYGHDKRMADLLFTSSH